jgi:hypothetical protein
MDVLGSVKGRGKSGLDQQQILELNAAIELLEQDGGVSGECQDCCQAVPEHLQLCKLLTRGRLGS